MKHIRKFNESLYSEFDVKNIIADIKDIFLDEVELGYHIKYDISSTYPGESLIRIPKEIGDIDIYISKVNKSLDFSPNDIKESLERTIHYMSDLNYECKMLGSYQYGRIGNIFKLDPDSINFIRYLHIKFRKI